MDDKYIPQHKRLAMGMVPERIPRYEQERRAHEKVDQLTGLLKLRGGGAVKKTGPKKAMRGGGAVNKHSIKRLRGGGAVKKTGLKKAMRGGGAVNKHSIKRFRGGGAVKKTGLKK
jgi:hypothetical protein